MSRMSNKQPVLISLLDKLIDEAPEQLTERPPTPSKQLSMLYESVRRDLENLLNTRQRSLSWPKELSEISASLYAYGVPDFMNYYTEDQVALTVFCQAITDLIKQFEPRFKEVNVTIIQNANHSQLLRLRIDGLLYAEPQPEPIVLDSVLEPESQTFIFTETTI